MIIMSTFSYNIFVPVRNLIPRGIFCQHRPSLLHSTICSHILPYYSDIGHNKHVPTRPTPILVLLQPNPINCVFPTVPPSTPSVFSIALPSPNPLPPPPLRQTPFESFQNYQNLFGVKTPVFHLLCCFLSVSSYFAKTYHEALPHYR